MKVRTFIILLILAITPLFAVAQEDVVESYYRSGIGWYAFFDDVDSTIDVARYYSQFFDMSNIDGQTFYVTYRATSDANDTMHLIIQGKYNDSLIIDMDTLDCICNIGVAQLTSSMTAFMPIVRFKIENQNTTGGLAADDKELRIFMYAKSLDTTPYYRVWGNANP